MSYLITLSPFLFWKYSICWVFSANHWLTADRSNFLEMLPHIKSTFHCKTQFLECIFSSSREWFSHFFGKTYFDRNIVLADLLKFLPFIRKNFNIQAQIYTPGHHWPSALFNICIKSVTHWLFHYWNWLCFLYFVLCKVWCWHWKQQKKNAHWTHIQWNLMQAVANEKLSNIWNLWRTPILYWCQISVFCYWQNFILKKCINFHIFCWQEMY